MVVVLNRPISRRALSAWAFAAGVVVGTVVLSLLGRYVSARSYFEGFERFHRFISPDSFFYPTASQVRSLALASGGRDRVMVIVGGSSVLYGAGQGADELWTKHLQAVLGEPFVVMNFAFLAGAPQEHGAVAAQSLLKDGFKVVYVTDARPDHIGAQPDGSRHRYVFWDAYYKGLLPEYDERIERIETLAGRGAQQDLLAELRLRARLDSWLYFTDLWQAFGYTTIFTTWSQYVEPPVGLFTTPRKHLQDPFATYRPEPVATRYQRRDVETIMRGVRTFPRLVCETRRNGREWVDVEPRTDRAAAEADAVASFPEPFRRHMVVTVNQQSPFFVEQLSAGEQRCYRRYWDQGAASLQKLGFRAVVTGRGFSAEDYDDDVHLAAGGGRKLAERLAPIIRDVAEQHQYLE